MSRFNSNFEIYSNLFLNCIVIEVTLGVSGNNAKQSLDKEFICSTGEEDHEDIHHCNCVVNFGPVMGLE